MSGPRYLGLIPARGGSKGIPKKNLVDLGGRPLLEWTLAASRASVRLDRALLTSDDESMRALAVQHGVEAPFTRPAALSGDGASTLDVVLHALDWLAAHEGWTPTAVVLLQPTSPFRDGADIDAAVAAFEASGASSLLSVSPVLQHPCDMVMRGAHGDLVRVAEPTGHARQSFPDCWFIDGAIYITTVEMLRERRLFHDAQSATYHLPAERAADIDTPFQLQLARALVACSDAPARRPQEIQPA